jgi:type I restriction enzyme M protein
MSEQEFLKELEAKLWKAANKLLPALDAAVYKHAVLGLVFVKYVSDSFETRRVELRADATDPNARLVAYRWDGEQKINTTKFVFVNRY